MKIKKLESGLSGFESELSDFNDEHDGQSLKTIEGDFIIKKLEELMEARDGLKKKNKEKKKIIIKNHIKN